MGENVYSIHMSQPHTENNSGVYQYLSNYSEKYSATLVTEINLTTTMLCEKEPRYIYIYIYRYIYTYINKIYSKFKNR